mmetsp:Transcript_366/g.828  ORF Transcript_366/g.828 Transcript_366/m.828 type:complete len:653 (+) Transcript_366:36-1994(+)|eukprot:CAMPEP_0177650834 /NCGR_PEP_ID=MMETSP0447-20121125/12176_1 /TAXON_ID=0 /ORGANISM="Stygamoeba regulata, Strain BSH-02190019" /LENGTH=652 /DNA_ID=CAMNT_0019153775 /DNA_START=36 /DNA_END=1994 /DNA_ORIENTATION=+
MNGLGDKKVSKRWDWDHLTLRNAPADSPAEVFDLVGKTGTLVVGDAKIEFRVGHATKAKTIEIANRKNFRGATQPSGDDYEVSIKLKPKKKSDRPPRFKFYNAPDAITFSKRMYEHDWFYSEADFFLDDLVNKEMGLDDIEAGVRNNIKKAKKNASLAVICTDYVILEKMKLLHSTAGIPDEWVPPPGVVDGYATFLGWQTGKFQDLLDQMGDGENRGPFLVSAINDAAVELPFVDNGQAAGLAAWQGLLEGPGHQSMLSVTKSGIAKKPKLAFSVAGDNNEAVSKELAASDIHILLVPGVCVPDGQGGTAQRSLLVVTEGEENVAMSKVRHHITPSQTGPALEAKNWVFMCLLAFHLKGAGFDVRAVTEEELAREKDRGGPNSFSEFSRALHAPTEEFFATDAYTRVKAYMARPPDRYRDVSWRDLPPLDLVRCEAFHKHMEDPLHAHMTFQRKGDRGLGGSGAADGAPSTVRLSAPGGGAWQTFDARGPPCLLEDLIARVHGVPAAAVFLEDAASGAFVHPQQAQPGGRYVVHHTPCRGRPPAAAPSAAARPPSAAGAALAPTMSAASQTAYSALEEAGEIGRFITAHLDAGSTIGRQKAKASVLPIEQLRACGINTWSDVLDHDWSHPSNPAIPVGLQRLLQEEAKKHC